MVGEVLGSAMMSMVVHEEGNADPPAGLKSTVPSLVCNVGGYNNQQSDDAGQLDHGNPEAAAAHGAAGDHDHHLEAHAGSSKQFMSSGALVPPPVSRETVHRVGQGLESLLHYLPRALVKIRIRGFFYFRNAAADRSLSKQRETETQREKCESHYDIFCNDFVIL
jgi:hypothetical protein